MAICTAVSNVCEGCQRKVAHQKLAVVHRMHVTVSRNSWPSGMLWWGQLQLVWCLFPELNQAKPVWQAGVMSCASAHIKLQLASRQSLDTGAALAHLT